MEKADLSRLQVQVKKDSSTPALSVLSISHDQGAPGPSQVASCLAPPRLAQVVAGCMASRVLWGLMLVRHTPPPTLCSFPPFLHYLVTATTNRVVVRQHPTPR